MHKNPHLNVQKLTRQDILNINILTQNNLKKICTLIRRHQNAFQKASVIVMRANYPNGYILKESFKIMDEDREAKWIDIKLPRAKQDLNLGKVLLQLKFPTQMKMKVVDSTCISMWPAVPNFWRAIH